MTTVSTVRSSISSGRCLRASWRRSALFSFSGGSEALTSEIAWAIV
jgi:hypothetical protein